jgi:hypothetical protein
MFTRPHQKLRLSHHARKRMAEWGFQEHEVRRTIRLAETTWPGRHGCVEYVGTELIATVAPDGTVVTVKLISAERYTHNDDAA